MSSTTLDVTFGGGSEGGRRDVEQDARLRPPSRQHREAPIVGALGRRGDDALSHLALEHERQAIIERRPGLGLEPACQERGRDVVGKVGDDADRHGPGLGDQRRGRDAQRIAFDDFEPSRPMRGDLAKRAERAGVALDGDHLLGSLRQSARVSPPGPGPTSTTATPASGPAARAILRVRLRSKRKFCPAPCGLRAHAPRPRRGAAAARPRRGSSRQPVGELERRDEARRVGDPLSGDVERRAVIGGRAHERQAERDIDAVIEGEGLDRDQALVVIHRQRHVVARPRLGMEHRIGGKRPDDVNSFGPQGLDRGPDDGDLLPPHRSALPRVGIEPGDRQARPSHAENGRAGRDRRCALF